MTREDLKIPPGAIVAAIKNILTGTAILITSCGIVAGAAWYAVEPRINAFLDNREKPIYLLFESIQADLLLLKQAAAVVELEPFYRVSGRWKDWPNWPFYRRQQGANNIFPEKKSILQTDVQVRFWNRGLGRIDTALTYYMEGTQAPVTPVFRAFTVDVKLPDDMPPGIYSYRAMLEPEAGCGDDTPAPFSDYFEVVS